MDFPLINCNLILVLKNFLFLNLFKNVIFKPLKILIYLFFIFSISLEVRFPIFQKRKFY